MKKPLVTTTVTPNGVATVTIDNPTKHNAFDDVIITELTDAFISSDTNKDIRVVILASNGKNFSAGADLDWMKRMASYSFDENLTDAQSLAAMFKALNFMSKPTIARIQGAVFGGAVGLVSCCDLAIATPQSRFCLSEVKIGLIPATIGPYVISAIGNRAARRYINTAEVFSAQTAKELQLISEISEEQCLDETIDKFVTLLLSNSPSAIKSAKKLIFECENHKIDHKLIDHTCEIIAKIRVSQEGKEGVNAFLEKRPATWTRNS